MIDEPNIQPVETLNSVDANSDHRLAKGMAALLATSVLSVAASGEVLTAEPAAAKEVTVTVDKAGSLWKSLHDAGVPDNKIPTQIQHVANANHLSDPNLVQPGDTFKVEVPDSAPKGTPAPNTRGLRTETSYTVTDQDNTVWKHLSDTASDGKTDAAEVLRTIALNPQIKDINNPPPGSVITLPAESVDKASYTPAEMTVRSQTDTMYYFAKVLATIHNGSNPGAPLTHEQALMSIKAANPKLTSEQLHTGDSVVLPGLSEKQVQRMVQYVNGITAQNKPVSTTETPSAPTQPNKAPEIVPTPPPAPEITVTVGKNGNLWKSFQSKGISEEKIPALIQKVVKNYGLHNPDLVQPGEIFSITVSETPKINTAQEAPPTPPPASEVTVHASAVDVPTPATPTLTPEAPPTPPATPTPPVPETAPTVSAPAAVPNRDNFPSDAEYITSFTEYMKQIANPTLEGFRQFTINTDYMNSFAGHGKIGHIQKFIIHWTAGSPDETVESFIAQMKKDNKDVQFYIDKNGTAYQLVANADVKAWHAGAPGNGLGPGAEIAARGLGDYNPAQMNALVYLALTVGYKWGAPITADYLTGHSQVSTEGKIDPPPLFADMLDGKLLTLNQEILADNLEHMSEARKAVQPTPPSPAPVPKTAPAQPATSLPAPEAAPTSTTSFASSPKESSPSSKLNLVAIKDTNGVDAVTIAHDMQIMSDEEGLTPQGSSMLEGDFIQEAGSAGPQATGDGGRAHGLAQWRQDYGRDAGLPSGRDEQIKWALDVEMPRSGNPELVKLLRDPNATVEEIEQALYKWERYGVKGKRTEYGRQILESVKAASQR